MSKILTDISLDWGNRCFGPDHMKNGRIRSMRVAEEGIELAQACDVPADVVHKMVDMVYSRPKGSLVQEAGGIMVTVAVFCKRFSVVIQMMCLRQRFCVVWQSLRSILLNAISRR